MNISITFHSIVFYKSTSTGNHSLHRVGTNLDGKQLITIFKYSTTRIYFSVQQQSTGTSTTTSSQPARTATSTPTSTETTTSVLPSTATVLDLTSDQFDFLNDDVDDDDLLISAMPTTVSTSAQGKILSFCKMSKDKLSIFDTRARDETFINFRRH